MEGRQGWRWPGGAAKLMVEKDGSPFPMGTARRECTNSEVAGLQPWECHGCRPSEKGIIADSSDQDCSGGSPGCLWVSVSVSTVSSFCFIPGVSRNMMGKDVPASGHVLGAGGLGQGLQLVGWVTLLPWPAWSVPQGECTGACGQAAAGSYVVPLGCSWQQEDE